MQGSLCPQPPGHVCAWKELDGRLTKWQPLYQKNLKRYLGSQWTASVPLPLSCSPYELVTNLSPFLFCVMTSLVQCFFVIPNGNVPPAQVVMAFIVDV
jgi:hypothetical protein